MHELVEKHWGELEKEFGIEIVVLRELGKVGVIKKYLENGRLDKKKNLLWMNASDILKINPLELVKYHLKGLEKGAYVTVVVQNFSFLNLGFVW